MKIKGIEVFKCLPYKAKITRRTCETMKAKSQMKPTKTLFLHLNELRLCRDCEGIK